MAGLGNKFQSFIPNNPAVPGSVAIYPPAGASIPVARLVPGGTPAAGPQRGGAREEGLSAESLVLGGTVVAILGAGAFKLAVDYLIPN
jgi:hypothetical protein